MEIEWLARLGFSTNHTHSDKGSNLRMLDSIARVKNILDRAIELGYKGVVLTEHEAVTSHVPMMTLVEDYKKEGKLPKDFKVGYGNEIYLVNSIDDCRNKLEKYNHFIVVAKDKHGHEIIRRLSSCAWGQSYKTGKMRRTPIQKDQLVQIMEEYEGKGHIQVSTACLGNELSDMVFELLKTGNIATKHKIHNYIKFCKDVFGEENVFLEIQPSHEQDQIEYNKFMMKLSKAYNLPVQITNDVHYIQLEHKPIHAAYLSSRDADRETDSFYNTCYMMTIEEMWDFTKEYLTQEEFTNVVSNTTKFVDQLEQYNLFQSTIVPARDISSETWEVRHIFRDWYDKCSFIKRFSESEFEQDRFFLSEIEKGFLEKKIDFNEEAITRIDHELEELWLISEKLGERMSSYYNLVQMLVDIMWTVSVVGVSRGSVAGFFICYLTDIHQLNPLEYKLTQYWRHVERNKVSLADIDCDASGDKKAQILDEVKKALGYENVLNIMTIKTEKTKSAVLTVMRGIGVNNDEAQYIASLIEQERGNLFSLKDTWYGNEEKERKPNRQFINEIEKLSEEKGLDVREALFTIEGMVSGYSSHACGVNIYNNGYIKQNSMMVAPNGLPITAWTMHDSELVGDLKVDFLSTDAVSKLQICLDLLVKDGVIEWQGSLRETYNKYLHPDVIKNYNNPIMWDRMNQLKIPSLFQFGDSEVGRTAMRKVKPTNIYELATANSLMRLMPSSREAMTPLDKYVLYKNDITKAYDEMKEYGLSEEEMEIVKENIGHLYYCCDTQEAMMEVLMHPKVSGFDRRESDGARKLVGKKLMSKIPQLREDYFTKGKSLGTSDNLLNYMWDICILPQLGYSFSILHTTGYSMIAIQEAYLSTKYNPLYWACAVLTSNSGSIHEEEEEDEEPTEGEEGEEVAESEAKKIVTNYDKVARAIGDLKKHGIVISPPYVNKAKFSFTPDVKGNQIIYSLKAISGVSDDTADSIVKNQPYASLEDFDAKVPTKKIEKISLIKSGALDEFNPNRVELMGDFIKGVVGVKDKLNGQNIDFMIKNRLVPPQFSIYVRYHKYKKYILDKKFFHCIDDATMNNKTPKKWFKLDGISETFFNEEFIHLCTEGKHYAYGDDGAIIVRNDDIQNVIKKAMSPLYDWMGEQEATKLYNDFVFFAEWNKYCQGTISKWEMDSLCYYYHEHELMNVDKEHYLIKDFSDLPEEPKKIGEFTWRKKLHPIYELNRIVGTVIGRNNTKHIISLLTSDGVVDVKFYGGAYSHYNKQVSRINPDGTKTVIEKSWFKRGEKLCVYGFRQGDMFKPKRYNDSILQHTIQKIVDVSEDGANILLQNEREQI